MGIRHILGAHPNAEIQVGRGAAGEQGECARCGQRTALVESLEEGVFWMVCKPCVARQALPGR